MQIECIHKIDSDEPDESGMCSYYYEYDIYLFTDGPSCFVARSYTDDPDKAHFLGVETNGSPRALKRSDLTHPLFLAALSYLHSEGKVHVSWLPRSNWLTGGGGYKPVPADSQHGRIYVQTYAVANLLRRRICLVFGLKRRP